MTKIALIQQPASGSRGENINKGVAAIREAAGNSANLLCFSELAFDRFFPAQPAGPDRDTLAETIPGPTTDVFTALARELEVVIVLNFLEMDGGKTFDSSPVIDADGAILGSTRMVHVPDYPCFHEKGYYTPGDRGAAVYDTAIGRIGVAICYDRHYPEYMRALAVAGAELVLTPQAGAADEWPDGLFEAEMRVAAFQNGFFTALCNRVGKEPRMEFAGESFVCNPAGVVIARAGRGSDEILYSDLDFSEVALSHARKLFLADRRPALYRDWIES
ncbi:MAG: carbon-nitrogen hydrolase family protein [Gammaproteobacteria bacterium]|nr:carbon-nitrogen hydrolase family protein [Pseudomonadota bacterium]MCZ6537957.1 carbon-nitrogen hydrolase family protein [Gammaproteobacteria bacterium]MCZ6880181.1 carbon-nitrogen hydrolase family protein [Gammaproteobacteria bacterium]TDJ11454.1 MAG: carbon-nitrogen hydrolase family protein [Gammaproteobacteria bacterium]